MSDVSSEGLAWIAQRHGQNWRDEEALAAIEWLTSLVPRNEWEGREAAAATRFELAKAEWALGRRAPISEVEDQIAWYVLQGRFYADPALRPNWFEPAGYRIAPLFRRLGQLMPDLLQIEHAEERAARIMTHGRNQPDDGFYELLVGAAYKRRGWHTVQYVPETPGGGKVHDLLATRGRSRRAVECKRAGRSGYAQEERRAGERMADAVHEMCRIHGQSIFIIADFTSEITHLPINYLSEKANHALGEYEVYEWADDIGRGIAGNLSLERMQRVLLKDYIYFGSSRMVQLLLGFNPLDLDTSIDGDWTSAEGFPFHANRVSRISIVGWRSQSEAASRRKALHFRSLIAKAARQLPGDCPGVIHVGYEAVEGNAVEDLRHKLNLEQMRNFDAQDSRLQWVYGNYWMPEHVVARNESAAVTETTAWYRVGRSRTPDPLPNHMLFIDEDGRPGTHFVR